MIEQDQETVEQRLLMLLPTGKDADLTASILRNAGIDCCVCAALKDLADRLEEGAAAILIAEEAVADDPGLIMKRILGEQPAWSDLPVLIVTGQGADSAVVEQAVATLGNVTLLERPLRIAALVSATRTAIRARQRQYLLRDQFDALRTADRRKDEFLATLAHELRNPLAPIRNSLHILRHAGSNDPMLSSVCEMMERQVSHMVRLVDDLMEVSRITRGKIELHKERIDAADIVRSAVETSHPLIDAAKHELIIRVPPEPLPIDGDAVRLAQVLSNLLNNAAKYTPDGGRIWLTVRRDGDEVAISVKDTGMGISQEMLPRVFEMFTQDGTHLSRAQGGLGIGLSLVSSLVQMHGGRVEAHSDGQNHGSEFIIRLPLVITPRATPVNSSAGSTARVLPNHRILVVDDNHDAGDSLGMLLRALGAEAKVVLGGREALSILPEFQPSVVLLDIGMPEMDGYEVARRIRQEPRSQAITLIALTGWGQDDDRQRTHSAGFDYHLTKPADLVALRKVLDSVAVKS